MAVVGCRDDAKLFERVPAEVTGITFRNDIVESVDNNIMTYQYMYNGAGVALGDFDGDGTTDIFLVGNSTDNALYLNRGDFTFKEVAAPAGVTGRAGHWRTGVTTIDINGDGLLDLYLCYSGNVSGEGMEAPLQRERPERANQLFINQGSGPAGIPTFVERAAEYGLEATGTFSSQAYFLDYDRDGDPDMFLVNHANMFYSPFFNTSVLRAKRHPYFGNRLYRNDDSHFVDVSEAAGIHGSGLNYGLSAAVADFDGDEWPDIFVTNDYDEQDYLYLNGGDGTFREVSHTAFGHLSKYSMGSDVADINGDGRFDLFMADMLPADNYRQKLLRGPDKYDRYQVALDSGFHHQNMRNMLQVNAGTGADGVPRFREIGQMAGIGSTDWSWATLFADFDQDRRLDLFVTNGYLRDYTNMDFLNYAQDRMGGGAISAKPHGRQALMELIERIPVTPLPNYAFRGTDSLTFTDVAREWGLDRPTISNGAAYGDLDGDGDLDLVVNNLNDAPDIYRNTLEAEGHRYLRVELSGKAPNTQALGAIVEVYVGDDVLRRQAYYTRGYQSSVEPILTFGLGDATTIDSLYVKWPDGSTSRQTAVAVDRLLHLRQEQTTPSALRTAVAPAIFRELPATALDYRHRENKFVDFKVQRLIPYQASRLGGKLAVGDVDGNGVDEVYFGGARGQAGRLFKVGQDSNFYEVSVPAFDKDADSEDAGALFFDANGDGHPDLYVVSGGNEMPPGHTSYQDRLYLNDGRGGFVSATTSLPQLSISGSTVAAADYDHDGDLDLFVGGRIEPGAYPLAPRSVLLRNDSEDSAVKFTEVTAEVSQILLRPGMVTGAVWQDLDRDGWPDLVLVGEWMPVTVLRNVEGRSFIEATEDYGLASSQGWWSTIVAHDVDRDGDIDFVLGNAGRNLPFTATPERPLELYVYDLNSDGYPDPIMAYHLGQRSFPAASYDEMASQMADFRRRYPTYADYARTTTDELIGSVTGKEGLHLRINELRSCWLEQRDGELLLHPLPPQAQRSMVNGVAFDDFDGDGREEVLLVGNFYPFRVEWGPSDASSGVLLESRADSLHLDHPDTSLPFNGDVRGVGVLRSGGSFPGTVVISRNDAEASLYRYGGGRKE